MENNDKDKSNKPFYRDQKPRSGGEDEGGFKFNFVWVLLLLGVVLALFNLPFFQHRTDEISMTDLRQKMADHEVKAIEIQGGKEGYVYLDSSALSLPKYKNIAKNTVFNSTNLGPHYVFTVASNDKFADFLLLFYKDHPDVKEIPVYLSLIHI